ncbi:MAG: Asp-tRNA(Asn)/Glu-tRNA(Gln) amidotransferase subunit GatB [Verrucomicrobiae bacterium]|nr:Asp-tRNA(Asn)/Glu-tRNA(Gln) amidotransferase subunit GatB [Verrucomicrobiae bacterium]
MNYEAVIGLEVHVQLKTRTKMFCGCVNAYGGEPNSQTCPVCLGMPGVMPSPNEQAIRLTALSGLLLGCDIAPRCKFDRKNYFYADMPKNYQISQYDLPICLNGQMELMKECYPKDAQKDIQGVKQVKLTRIHLEEDVGKSFHFENCTGVDFDRAGAPLMEIVTQPDLNTPEEAFAFLSTLRLVLLYGKVSDADMEKGQMRCDVNVSIRPAGEKKLGTKIELKNLNSISGARRALAYEIERQKQALARGEKLVQETRRWDDDAGVTSSMRSKEMAHDYRYFPEPDLLPIDTTPWLDEVKRLVPELPMARKQRFMQQYQIADYNAGVLVADMDLADYFEKAAAHAPNPNAAANLIVNDLMRELGAASLPITQSPILPKDIAALTTVVESGKISSKQAKDVFAEMFKTGKNPDAIIAEKGLSQVSDAGAIEKFCDEVIAANPKIVTDIRSGNAKAVGALVGQVMKLSKGKANPAMVNEFLKKKLS